MGEDKKILFSTAKVCESTFNTNQRLYEPPHG